MEENDKQATMFSCLLTVCQQVNGNFLDLEISKTYLELGKEKSNVSSEPESSSDITLLTILF